MINLYIFYIIMIIFGLTLTIIAIRLREIEGVFLVFIILSIFIIGLSISELNNIIKHPENYQPPSSGHQMNKRTI